MYKRNVQGWMKHLDFILWDELVLQISFILGYMIRHGFGQWPYARQDYRELALIFFAMDILVAIGFNTMHNVLKRKRWKELAASVKHVLLVLGIVSLYLFSAQKGDIYSRITIYLTSAFHLAIGYGVRQWWKPIVRKINQGIGRGRNTVILVAEEGSVEKIRQKAGETDGFEFAGLVLCDRDATGETVSGIPVVASLESAGDYICREWVDEVFVCPDSLSEQSPLSRLIAQCREMAVPVHLYIPAAASGGKSFMEKANGFNVLTLTANYANPLQSVIKRLADILGGLVGSLIALILLAILSPKIRKESPGPVLFKQTRVGQNGKRFTIYKIRSMYMDAEERKAGLMEQNRITDGRMFKLDFDPRIIGNRIVDGKQVTGIGETIRSWSLDEFPQFFNVLKGEMSLVGTRPPTEDEWTKYHYHHRARLAVKPGVTGLWQTSGRSGITDFEKVVRLDTEYINNWSLALDLKILLKTVRIVLKRDGAM